MISAESEVGIVKGAGCGGIFSGGGGREGGGGSADGIVSRRGSIRLRNIVKTLGRSILGSKLSSLLQLATQTVSSASYLG